MHATAELKRLGEVKAGLRRRIAQRRAVTGAQVARVARPLQWVDRIRGYWRRVGPLARLAAAPAGWWLFRRGIRHRKGVGSMLRWAPMAWRIAQTLGARGLA